ncbi:phosphoglycerol transferase MdoB-like AlkP superfamily enzyme [Chryseobacterium defluvii]|uniref:Phosphoglycerol transferase MdoB-like AlkP superfamily enzyme n=1 Tax=Chryseobacterium defluvii TaxID=160396 RepID=A0A840KE17_9FLAO|nr:hypothetical protein [Chryseobacterium defluvii]MBB4805793.1 phosphoglycerol transferase MdoB-like AlkP superfamily enzyme [Chryseobacterium defluvii]
MNIDELKNTWNEDDSFEETPEISIEHKNKINLPLEKMRKNMRMELWSTVAIFIFSFALIALCEAPFKFKFYVAILIASMVFVTFFFFSKFFTLYKEMSNPVLNTYDGLNELLHQFNLNKQYYLSFYVAFAPFLVCELVIVLEFIPRPVPLTEIQIATTLISALVIGLFTLSVVGTWWFKRFYGRHIDQVEALILQLKK